MNLLIRFRKFSDDSAHAPQLKQPPTHFYLFIERGLVCFLFVRTKALVHFRFRINFRFWRKQVRRRLDYFSCFDARTFALNNVMYNRVMLFRAKF